MDQGIPPWKGQKDQGGSTHGVDGGARAGLRDLIVVDIAQRHHLVGEFMNCSYTLEGPGAEVGMLLVCDSASSWEAKGQREVGLNDLCVCGFEGKYLEKHTCLKNVCASVCMHFWEG